ncbi:trx-2, partial [Pristionchus pacificus]
ISQMRFLQSALSLTSRILTAQPARTTQFIVGRAPLAMARRPFSDGQPVVFAIESVDDFNQCVINSPTPVLVDFHADWCGPCQLLGPRLEEKVASRAGAVLMAKVNVDDAGELATEYNISAVPTIMAFTNGECVGEFKGNISDEELDSFIENAIEASQ